MNLKQHDIQTAFDFLVVATLLVVTGIWTYKEFLNSPPYVDPDRYPIRGIDVSAHNGMMNLKAAAQDGISFIFIKASEGETFQDENFRINYVKSREAGLAIGAYHYFRFDKDGVSQAQNLLSAVGERKLDMGLAIDVEAHGNAKDVPLDSITERLSRMIEYLNLRGHRVILYSNKDGYYDYLARDFQGIPLWICSFNSDPINADWAFWQYYHRGKVKGIKGDVDLDAFGGSRDDWDLFLTTGILPSSV